MVFTPLRLRFPEINPITIEAISEQDTSVRMNILITIVPNTQIMLPTEVRAIPEKSALLPNYPNPFNPETWLPYQLSKSADVVISIYDVQGQLIRQLDLGGRAAGFYTSLERPIGTDRIATVKRLPMGSISIT